MDKKKLQIDIQNNYKHFKINIMKIKILFITLLFFILLSLKSNGQTNTAQTLDEKYPYYYVFWENEKITIEQ